MSDQELIQLKVVVERAVRPVRAALKAKLKMRRELLAHLLHVYEEECRRADGNDAMARARERFGDPATLTRQLQDSVRRRDYVEIFLEDMIGINRRESMLQRAARFGIFIGALFLVSLLGVMPFVGDVGQWWTIPRLPALLMPITMAILAFFAMLLTQGLRQAMYGVPRRSWTQMAAIALASCLLLPALIFLCCIALGSDVSAALSDAVFLLAFAPLAPLGLFIIVPLVHKELLLEEEWLNLDLTAAS